MIADKDFIPGAVLAERENAGLKIFLLHSFATSETRVAMRIGEETTVSAIVPNEKALEAFYHPAIFVADELALAGIKL